MAGHFKNHHILKQRKIEAFKQTKGKCYICDKDAQEIHHINGSKTDHRLINLIAICPKCHQNLHQKAISREKKRTATKYAMELGMPIGEIAKKLNVSESTVYGWIKKPKKREWLEQQIKEEIQIDDLDNYLRKLTHEQLVKIKKYLDTKGDPHKE